jgi:hypothetical protein
MLVDSTAEMVKVQSVVACDRYFWERLVVDDALTRDRSSSPTGGEMSLVCPAIGIGYLIVRD